MWVNAEYLLDGPNNVRLVLRRHLFDQDLNRLLLHAPNGVCVPGLDVDAPDIHCRLDHRWNHPTRHLLNLLRSVQRQHPGSGTAEHQAKVPAALQHRCRLQRVAYLFGLPFVCG